MYTLEEMGDIIKKSYKAQLLGHFGDLDSAVAFLKCDKYKGY